jgi:hypothetical protein
MTQQLNEFGFPVIPEEPEPPDLDQIRSIWYSIDPCAFLCYAIQIQALPFDATIKQTLDAFGWLNPDGFPDYDKMQREFQNHKTRYRIHGGNKPYIHNAR